MINKPSLIYINSIYSSRYTSLGNDCNRMDLYDYSSEFSLYNPDRLFELHIFEILDCGVSSYCMEDKKYDGTEYHD